MNSCCIKLITKILGDSTFEPLILCSTIKPILINERALELFEYSDRKEFMKLDTNEMIQKHFTPSKIKDKFTGLMRDAKVNEICFATVTNYSNISQTAVVKVNSWILEDEIYYSIGIRDIPLLKMIPEKGSIAIIDRISNKEKTEEYSIIDPISEPELESRLLHEFSQMANALPSMIWVMGNQGDVHYQNSKVEETFGVNTVTEGWEECIHPDDRSWFFPYWTENFKKRATFSLEVRYGNKNKLKFDENYSIDNFRWHFFQATPILDGANNLTKYIVNAVDIQDLKEAEAERQRLIALEKMAVESSKLKSAFLSMMSHEIRTPLFGIVGNACLLLDTEINELQREYIENIDGSAKLMMAVVQDILDFSRIEAGKLELYPEPFSFKSIINLLLKTIGKAAERKKLNFEYEEMDEDIKLIGDSMRILQVLINITSNAIKFTKVGTISFKINKSIESSGKLKLMFTIKDTGVGINPELIPEIYTPWVQGDSSNRRLFGGSGLGLAISKSLIDMMDGNIDIQSKVGQGTVVNLDFKLDFANNEVDIDELRSQSNSPVTESKFEFYTLYESPIVIQKDISVKDNNSIIKRDNKKENKTNNQKISLRDKFKSKKQTKKSINGTNKPNKYRLLLAEDNPINQAILKRFLDKMGGVEYFIAEDGIIALEEYKRHPIGYFNIILLDQSMPRMDGDMVCQKIRQIDQNQIIISVSANTLLSDRKYFQSIGMNDHISKPVTYKTFENVLSKWLEQLNFNSNSINHPPSIITQNILPSTYSNESIIAASTAQF